MGITVSLNWLQQKFSLLRKPSVLYLLFLVGWYAFFLFHQIDISGGDLGRHLQNGRIIVEAVRQGESLEPILRTNFYAATLSDAPFINHHWGSGVIFFLVWQLAGYTGLIFFSACTLVAALLLFWAVIPVDKRGFGALIAGFLIVPLLAERNEIRPEIFSYLFVGIFYYILERYRRGNLKNAFLLLLPIIQVLWVNLHIYFFLGPCLVGLYFLRSVFSSLRQHQERLSLGLLLVFVVLVGLANPAGGAGLFYPLAILEGYGFEIQENLPLPAVAARYPWHGPIVIFKSISILLVVGSVLLFVKKRTLVPWLQVILFVVFFVLTWRMVRNIALFGFFSIPFAGLLIVECSRLFPSLNNVRSRNWFLSIGIVLLSTFFINRAEIIRSYRALGITVAHDSAGAGEFIRQQSIAGPLFNDFDSGSYLIWYVFPRIRPFVDNRPEAYRAAFYNEVYAPLHQNEEVWKEVNEMYGFNALVYSFSNKSPWTFPFIIRRLQDPAWAPVFANRYTIVFLKRNPQNEKIIKLFEIPLSSFSVVGS